MARTLARAALALLVTGGTLVGWASSAWAANCPDFPSQAAAQAHLRADPTDPDGLDRDADGIACEDNAAPKDLVKVDRSGRVATPTTAVTTGTVTATPTVAAATTSGLAGTGLRHTDRFVELAIVFLGLGAALVLEVRARNGRDRLRRQ